MKFYPIPHSYPIGWKICFVVSFDGRHNQIAAYSQSFVGGRGLVSSIYFGCVYSYIINSGCSTIVSNVHFYLIVVCCFLDLQSGIGIAILHINVFSSSLSTQRSIVVVVGSAGNIINNKNCFRTTDCFYRCIGKYWQYNAFGDAIHFKLGRGYGCYGVDSFLRKAFEGH